jgi:predicted ATPase
VLPIVLQHDERVLVIDQPEDHIDNAFITDSLIKAIRARSPHSQLIVSTHNANIPVLGDAKLVVQLTSDGRNGSVEVCSPLDDDVAVDAITSLMEGGIDAFRKRAAFYDAHLT